MPQLLWLYLTALLYYRTSVSCVAFAEALQTVSHDRLTRLLQANWSGHTLLELACRTLFVWERGYLIIDDTVLPKPFATAIQGLAWVFSSQERKPVYGLSRVLLVWTDGSLRIPLGLRLWHKGGLSKYALAPGGVNTPGVGRLSPCQRHGDTSWCAWRVGPAGACSTACTATQRS